MSTNQQQHQQGDEQSAQITEPLLLETLTNVVQPVLDTVSALLAKGDSEGGVTHEHRYEAIRLLSDLSNTLLEWYSDCEAPFITGEILPGWAKEAGQYGSGGGDEKDKVPKRPIDTFTSIAFSVTVAKVMITYGLANYDAQETLAGYKAVEQACAVLERIHESGHGITGAELAEMCSFSRRQYVTAGAPKLIFSDVHSSTSGGEGACSAPARKTRKTFAGSSLLLDCYVYMCMAWGRWNDADHIATCLNAATHLATELRQHRDEHSRQHKLSKIDHIVNSHTHASEHIAQIRLDQEDSQLRAIEERIRAKKAKAAAAKAAASGTGASSPSLPSVVAGGSPLSAVAPGTPGATSASASPTLLGKVVYSYCFVTTERSNCQLNWLSWSWATMAVAHTENLATSSPSQAIVKAAKDAVESGNNSKHNNETGKVPMVVLQSSKLLEWLHSGCLETEEAIRACEARLLTASAHANKAANSLAATMYCHKSLAHQVSNNLLKSPQDVEDWVYAALNLAEFYLSKEDLSHLEHCMLSVDSLLKRAKLTVPVDDDKDAAGTKKTPVPPSPQTTSSTTDRVVTDVWPSFDVLQYRYLWASLHHHLLLLSQNALTFHSHQHQKSASLSSSSSSTSSSPQFPMSDAVIGILQRGAVWVKCRMYQNPLLLPEGVRNLPSDERDAYILENVKEGSSDSSPTSSSTTTVAVKKTSGADSSSLAGLGAWGLNERISFGMPGVPPPRTHMLVALPPNPPQANNKNTVSTTTSTPVVVSVVDPIIALSIALNPALNPPSPRSATTTLVGITLGDVTYFDGCGWPTATTTEVSRFASPRPEVADHTVAKYLVGAIRHITRMHDQLLFHTSAAAELSSVEMDFEKFLFFRRMEADGWLTRYLTSRLPVLASSFSSPSPPTDTSSFSFPSHYSLGPDPLFPGEFSIRHLQIERLPNQRDTYLLERRIASIQRIYETELNPKAYRNVVRQADYDSGWSCLDIALEATNSIKMHVAMASGNNKEGAEDEVSLQQQQQLDDARKRKAKFLDLSLRHFKNFVTGFYNEITAAMKAGKQASDALEPSDFPTLFVGEMRIVEVLLKQGNITDAMSRLSNHALDFLKKNPSVLRDYPELNANKQQCEELLKLLQAEGGGGGTPQKKGDVSGDSIHSSLAGDIKLSTRPYVPTTKKAASVGGGRVLGATGTGGAPLPVQRVRAPAATPSSSSSTTKPKK